MAVGSGPLSERYRVAAHRPLRTNFRVARWTSATELPKELAVIRLILVGATGYLLATRPDLRERVLGAARQFLDRLTVR